MQHVEFFHKDHFSDRYKRISPRRGLADYIDFFWETDFDSLWKKYPSGFSDALFPNTGYTYMINMGTPFVMELRSGSFEIKSGTFLPRTENMICHHAEGNRIFGIKFKVSPIVLQKKIDFSEYRGSLFPLAYLIDNTVIERIKTADSFEKRVEITTDYYNAIIDRYSSHHEQVKIVTAILKECNATNNFCVSVEELAGKFGITSRSLLRYFDSATGTSCKKALQIMRIRKAVEDLTSGDKKFHYSHYGYYDHSHFYKHLKSFLNDNTLRTVKPLLKLGEVISEPGKTAAH